MTAGGLRQASVSTCEKIVQEQERRGNLLDILVDTADREGSEGVDSAALLAQAGRAADVSSLVREELLCRKR